MRLRFLLLVAMVTVAGCMGSASEGPVLQTADSELGEIVVDGAGYTLYIFTADEGGVSACSGPCAETWPPVTAEISVGEGLDPALLDFVEREDGTEQARYGGFPLYRFSGDPNPGDTNGHGSGGSWFALTAEGRPVP